MFDYHIILDFEMNPVSKDEKEAFKNLRKEIIEIGAVKLDRNFNIADKFSVFVKPRYNRQVTPNITRLTGINSSLTTRAPYFETALERFVEWVGHEGKIRIYSWSNNDLVQLKTECDFKKVEFPENLKRWLDVQRIFPRIMAISNDRRQLALKEAVKYFEIKYDSRKVHDALYDSELTTELVIPLLTGEYKKQVECMLNLTQVKSNESTIGDMCGGVLAELLRQMQLESP